MWYERGRERKSKRKSWIQVRWRGGEEFKSASDQYGLIICFFLGGGWCALYVAAEEAEVAKKSWASDNRGGHRSPLFCWIALPQSWGPGRFSMDLSLPPLFTAHCWFIESYIKMLITPTHFPNLLFPPFFLPLEFLMNAPYRFLLGIWETFRWPACHHSHSYLHQMIHVLGQHGGNLGGNHHGWFWLIYTLVRWPKNGLNSSHNQSCKLQSFPLPFSRSLTLCSVMHSFVRLIVLVVHLRVKKKKQSCQVAVAFSTLAGSHCFPSALKKEDLRLYFLWKFSTRQRWLNPGVYCALCEPCGGDKGTVSGAIVEAPARHHQFWPLEKG